MLNLEDVLKMWADDSVIDDIRLDEASKDTAKLHAKYLEMLSVTKLQLKRRDMEFKVLLKNKWLWYNGKMSKDQIDQLGWEYDALNGLKVLKGEMDYYYDSDPHIQEAQAKIDYLKTLIETLEEIINTIRWRHSTIKNMIDWRKFESGG
jgi:thymidylate synthase